MIILSLTPTPNEYYYNFSGKIYYNNKLISNIKINYYMYDDNTLDTKYSNYVYSNQNGEFIIDFSDFEYRNYKSEESRFNKIELDISNDIYVKYNKLVYNENWKMEKYLSSSTSGCSVDFNRHDIYNYSYSFGDIILIQK